MQKIWKKVLLTLIFTLPLVTAVPGASRAGLPPLVSCSFEPATIALCPGTNSESITITAFPDPAFVVGCQTPPGGCRSGSFNGQVIGPFSYENLVSLGLSPGESLEITLAPGNNPGTTLCSFTATLLDSTDPQCGGGLVDTDVEDPFAQINDQPKADRDTWTIRGKVADSTASTVVSDGVENGVTVTMYETELTFTPVEPASPGLSVVDTFTFEPSTCRAVMSGRSLYCKDPATNSMFRARGVRSAKDPNSFRLNSIIRSQELTVTEPYGLPLAFEVELSGRLWSGNTDANYCRVTQNGERTTCRLQRAGGGK